MKRWITVIAMLALAPGLVRAADKPVTLRGVSATVRILGDSTMHKWEVDAKALSLSAEAAPKAGSLLDQAKAGAVTKLELSIPAKDLHSTEGGGMDKKMDSALEIDKAPAISFSLKSYSISGETVTAKGSLSIHNVAKDVELTGKLSLQGGALAVKGSFDLLMSDYGVAPPTAMFGAIKSKDKVTIAYDFLLAQ